MQLLTGVIWRPTLSRMPGTAADLHGFASLLRLWERAVRLSLAFAADRPSPNTSMELARRPYTLGC